MLLLVLIFPIGLLIIFLGKCIPETTRKFIRKKPLHQFMLVVVVAYAVHAAQKPPVTPELKVNQIITLLNDKFMDLSGRFVPWVKSLVRSNMPQELEPIYNEIDNIIADGTNTIEQLNQQVAGRDIIRAYITYDIPRSTPDNPDDNLAMRHLKWEYVTEGDNNYIDTWAWFSFDVTTNITIHAEYSIKPDIYTPLILVSNYWPTVEYVDDVACYRYRYRKPATEAALIPTPAVAFGGYDGQPLDTTGIIIKDGNNYFYGYTGWDDYSEDGVELRVRFAGGIAVEAVYQGVTYRATRTKTMSDNAAAE